MSDCGQTAGSAPRNPVGGMWECGGGEPVGRGTEVQPPAKDTPVGLGEPAAAETARELAHLLSEILADRAGVNFPGSGKLAPSQWVVAWGPGVGPQPLHIPGWLWEKAVAPLLGDRELMNTARNLALAGQRVLAASLLGGRLLPLVEASGRWGLPGK